MAFCANGSCSLCIVDHGRVVPVRLAVCSACLAGLQPIAVAVNAGAGCGLAGSTISVTGKSCKLRRGTSSAYTDSYGCCRGLGKSESLRVVAWRISMLSVERIGRNPVALVAFYRFHVNRGKALEVGTDANVVG